MGQIAETADAEAGRAADGPSGGTSPGAATCLRG